MRGIKSIVQNREINVILDITMNADNNDKEDEYKYVQKKRGCCFWFKILLQLLAIIAIFAAVVTKAKHDALIVKLRSAFNTEYLRRKEIDETITIDEVVQRAYNRYTRVIEAGSTWRDWFEGEGPDDRYVVTVNDECIHDSNGKTHFIDINQWKERVETGNNPLCLVCGKPYIHDQVKKYEVIQGEEGEV